MAGSLHGRSRELGLLRTVLDRTEGSVSVLSGLPGAGKSSLALAAAADLPHVYHRVAPLPDPQQRAAFLASLRRGVAGWRGGGGDRGGDDAADGGEPATAPSWEEIFSAAAASVPEGRGAVLVLDDAHRIESPGTRLLPALRNGLRRARERQRALHVILGAPVDVLAGADVDVELAPLRLRLGPLSFRSAAQLLPGVGALERLRAYSVFGGLPGHLVLLDRSASLTTNLRRLVLRSEAPLAEAGLALVERAAQAPGRYIAILSALAAGESDWGGIHAGVSDLTASGQVAPYLKRLEELGLVEVRRSLDAGPRSRSRRYRISDPLLAFWFRFVLPHRERFPTGDAADAVLERLRVELDDHVGSIFPEVCRQHMRHDAIESLGANARECGSLWGSGYDIPVAGILASGAAFYGATAPGSAPGRDELSALDRQIRETRYGFGREARLRILFLPGAPTAALAREAARRHDVRVVDAGALAGEN
jgi:AAA+ ATPase superfamily predicted ATPase